MQYSRGERNRLNHTAHTHMKRRTGKEELSEAMNQYNITAEESVYIHLYNKRDPVIESSACLIERLFPLICDGITRRLKCGNHINQLDYIMKYLTLISFIK